MPSTIRVLSILLAVCVGADLAPAQKLKVYILAGQSNMVGMGDVRGAKNRYTGVYLTADPAAAEGPVRVGRALYRIRRHGVHDATVPSFGTDRP